MVNRRQAVSGIGGTALAVLLASKMTGTASAAEDLAKNKSTFARLIDEVFNAGDLDVLDELLTEDFVGDGSEGVPGPAQFKDVQAQTRQALEQLFSTYQFEVTESAAEGVNLLARAMFTGKQIDATKPDVTAQGFMLAVFTDGKISQIWSLLDSNAILEQVGLA